MRSQCLINLQFMNIFYLIIISSAGSWPWPTHHPDLHQPALDRVHARPDAAQRLRRHQQADGQRGRRHQGGAGQAGDISVQQVAVSEIKFTQTGFSQPQRGIQVE